MMKKTLHLSLLLGLLGGGLTSCSDTDYFDREAYQELIKQHFPVDEVDSQHDWKTINSSLMTIHVQASQTGTYELNVYSKLPESGKENECLATGTVHSGDTFTAPVSYRESNPVVYVTLTDAKGFMSVYPRTIEGSETVTTVGDALITTKGSRSGSMSRAVQSSIQFADAPSDADFATSIPADAQPSTSYQGQNSGNFYVPAGTSKVDIWSGGINLYFGEGNHVINSFYVGGNTTIYLLPGANVTLANGFNNNQYQVKTCISAGATFTTTDFAIGHACYNRGTMHVTNMNNYYNSIFYNEGTVKVDNSLSVENWNTQLINAGTMTAASLTTAGGGHVLNLDSMKISGTTTVNSNNCTWQNDGSFQTGDFNYTAGSTNVINNCKMVVDDTFRETLGDTDRNCFMMDGNASVVTKNLYLSIGYIKMGSNAIFRVTDTATLDCTKPSYGIYGVGQERALFLANRIEAGTSSTACHVTYEGNLWVAYNSHFPQGNDGNVSHLNYFTGPNVAMAISTGDATIDIPASACSPGYQQNVTPAEKPKDEPFATRFCFEDNFPEPGDYDFNDFVASVSSVKKGDRTVVLTVTIEAVGASKQLAAALRLSGIHFNEIQSIDIVDGKSWFDLNNQHATSEKMLKSNKLLMRNTTANDTKDALLYICNDAHWVMRPEIATVGGVERGFYNTIVDAEHYNGKRLAKTLDPVTGKIEITFKNPEACNKMTSDRFDLFLIESFNGNYWEVHTFPYKTDCVIYNTNNGNIKNDYIDVYPWAIAVPGDFRYPREFQPIGSLKEGVLHGAYSTPGHSFGEWARDHHLANDWYLYPNPGMVY